MGQYLDCCTLCIIFGVLDLCYMLNKTIILINIITTYKLYNYAIGH